MPASAVRKAGRIRWGCMGNTRRKGVISDSTLSKYMREHELDGVPHGFRSTLRTWLTDHTGISYEIAEMIIAHQVGSQVERAYNRTDYLEQQRHYMELWSVFVSSQAQN